MALTTEETGRLMAYAIQGHPVEEYLADQEIPAEHEAEARELYQATTQMQERAAASGGYVSPISD